MAYCPNIQVRLLIPVQLGKGANRDVSYSKLDWKILEQSYALSLLYFDLTSYFSLCSYKSLMFWRESGLGKEGQEVSERYRHYIHRRLSEAGDLGATDIVKRNVASFFLVLCCYLYILVRRCE